MKKVLVVEDENLLVLVLSNQLKINGFEVKCVNNGLSAIETARTFNPDFIIMDIRLKGKMDGIEAMQQISSFSDVQAIYTTGNSERITKERALQTNHKAFLVKPINFDEILFHLNNVELKEDVSQRN